ncbi:MAG: tyrosine--tRNA ligase [Anaerolineales bacterium]|nr:tyrosine--tRNA ligase [Anaerolineales bacterium]
MDTKAQVDLLMQGTEYGDEVLKQAMADELHQRLKEAAEEGRPLRVYCGYDPTSTDLHLGHTITMRKLRQFQDFGHHVIFLIGNYTSLVGDPSDKDKLRPRLTEAQVLANAETYAEQAFRVLDKEKTEVLYNADWLSKITFAELIHLASNFTVQQFINRDNFKKRWDKGDPVYLHETFYAIMQAYDAFTMKADVQVGGSDQLFNIITAGRKLMAALGSKPNIGVICGILPGTDGEIRMSKSLGNHIPINSDAKDMFGKVMSIPDKAMADYARLATRWLPDEVEKFLGGVADGSTHPRDAKMALAQEITEIFYGAAEAEEARQSFVSVFQKGDVPGEMDEFSLEGGKSVLDVLVDSGLVPSRGEGRRMINQGGVRLDGEALADPLAEFPREGVLQVGKRRFIRIVKG